MPGPNLLQTLGSQSQKPVKFAPIFINRHFTGLYTQRNPLRDPSDSIREKFYGGRPDALLAGVNIELTNRLTLARRYGLSQFSATTYPTPPLCFYSFAKTSGGIDVIVDLAGAIYTDNQNGTKTLIANKSASAGVSQFVGVGNTLYVGDGVDSFSWTDAPGSPGNNNGNATNPSWKWGVVAPTVAPTVTVTPSGSAATSWQASTVFTTMGLLVDSNGNMQQLTSVNASGTNTTQFGTSGNGEPNWPPNTPNQQTTESTGTPITWTNRATVAPWAPQTLYLNFSATPTVTPAFCYDPVTKMVYGNSNPGLASGTSGVKQPTFIGIPGQFTFEANIKWCCSGAIPRWTASHSYVAYANSGGVGSTIVEPYSLPPLTGQPLYIQSANASGTSGSGGTGPPWNQALSGITRDNDLLYINLGNATRGNLTNYTAWQPGTAVFSAIKDTSTVPNSFYVCTTGGQSGAAPPASFNTGYGNQTQDGNVIWTCVGTAQPSWASATIWHYPKVGFSPPTSSSPYGGSSVVQSSTVEFVTISGKSQTPGPPTWTSPTTTDGTITWTNTGAYVAGSLVWNKSHTWAYSYESRLATDPYNTTAPPGWPNPLGPPTGSGSGNISTASPVTTITGANAGASVTLSGPGSTDPAVDTIVIWRDADGGGSSNMFELTEIPNPPPIGGAGTGQPGTWTFVDTLPDVYTSATQPGLNTFIAAPINHANDPPPAGFMPDTFHFQRVWGHVGNTLYFSGGPDTLVGNGVTTFPPTNAFTFPAAVVRALAHPTGLMVFTTDNLFLVAGGPQTSTFFSQPLLLGTGLSFFYALDIHGSLVYLYTSDRQFVSIDPSSGESELGFPIGDQLTANFLPSKTFVSAHVAGSADKAIYVADGSTGWYRLNPNQAPENNPVWSPKANIVNGAGAVQSIETSPGVHQLLVGGTGNNQPILKRDLTVCTDNGSPYPSNTTMGSLILAQPGQLACLNFVTIDAQRVGTSPNLSFLLDEVSGTFTTFQASNVSDPPELYGVAGNPTSLYSNRYYFNATMAGGNMPPPAWCRHMQILIDFGATDTVQNELMTLTIFGAHYQEK